MSILVVGDANADLTAQLTRFPSEGDDSPVSSLAWGSGGSAANAATALARLGAPARLLARVGTDPAASIALAAARAAGVDLGHVQIDAGVATGLCYAAISPGGERTFFAFRGANRLMQPPDHATLTGVTWIHVSGHALLEDRQAATTEALLTATTLPVSLDLCLPLLHARRDAVLQLLPRISVLFTNERELCALAGSPYAGHALDVLGTYAASYREYGVEVVAVKCGARGSLIVDERGIHPVAPFPVQAVDTNGCGDGFVAGYLTSMLAGAGPHACARYGNAVGALAATRTGAAEALPDHDDVTAFLALQLAHDHSLQEHDQ